MTDNTVRTIEKIEGDDDEYGLRFVHDTHQYMVPLDASQWNQLEEITDEVLDNV